MLNTSSGFKSAIKSVAPYSSGKVNLIGKTGQATLSNIILNGDFSDGLTSWGGANSTRSVTSGILSVLATSQFGRAHQTITTIASHKYYVASYSKADNNNIRTQVYASDGTTVLGFKAHSGGNAYELLSVIATATDTAIIVQVGRDQRASSFTTSYHDYVFVIDLTLAFGVGNEPTITLIDNYISNYGSYFLSAIYILGAIVNFTSDDIKSFEINGSAIVNDKVLGNIAQHSLTLELLGDKTSSINIALENILEVFIGVKVGSVYEYVRQQNFIVSEVSYSDTTNVTKVIATDYLVKLNNELWVDGNTYPMTLKAYLESVLLHCGLTLENTTFLNSAFSVASQPIANYTSCKEIIRQVAEMALSFVVINKVSNKLELRTAFELPSTVDDTLTKDNYSSLKLNDHNFGTLGVNTLVLKISQITGENTSVVNATNVAIDGAIEIVIEDNSFINTQALRESVDNAMFAIIDTYKFQPYALDYRGFAYLELGDIVEITKMDNSTIKLPIFETYIKYNGGVNGRLVAKSLNKSQTSYKYVSTNKNAQRGIEVIVDKVNGDFTILAGKYNNGELVATGRYVFDGTGASFYSDSFKLYDNSVIPVLKVYFDTVNSRYVFNGEISASVGLIGGFTIGATKLTAGATNATAVGVASGETYAFWAGHLTASSAPFRVTRAGAATMTSGAIAGWTIASTSISKGGIKLDSANERIYFNTDAYFEAGGASTSIVSSGNISPNSTTGVYGLGTSTNYWGTSYFDNLSPYASGLGNLGGNTMRWATLYLNTLNLRFSTTNYTITRDVNGFLKAV